MFSVLGSMVSKTSVNCVTSWKIPKIYLNSLGHDKINLDICVIKKWLGDSMVERQLQEGDS